MVGVASTQQEIIALLFHYVSSSATFLSTTCFDYNILVMMLLLRCNIPLFIIALLSLMLPCLILTLALQLRADG